MRNTPVIRAQENLTRARHKNEDLRIARALLRYGSIPFVVLIAWLSQSVSIVALTIAVWALSYITVSWLTFGAQQKYEQAADDYVKAVVEWGPHDH